MTVRTLTAADFAAWTASDATPVALHLRQPLAPVEGRDAVFFPATFADVGYNIDKLADGTKVAQVDSVGSQANRMEPLFLEAPFSALVPQIHITHEQGSTSLLEAGHRLGDAIIRCTKLHAELAQPAFLAAKKGDSGPLARVAPTSLVFGAWDSRDTQAKAPRIVQAVVRAWGVSELKRSAQYTPALEYDAQGVFDATDKAKAEKEGAKSPLAQRGFVHVPASGTHGGITAERILRDVTLNLVALRRLQSGENSADLRAYILGLSLVAAAEPIDPFYRQGCILVPDDQAPSEWTLVHRDGRRETVVLAPGAALAFAESAARTFGVAQPRAYAFDKALAKADTKKKDN